MTTTTMTPPEVDNLLADIMGRRNTAMQHATWAHQELCRHTGERGTSTRKGVRYDTPVRDALAKVKTLIEIGETVRTYNGIATVRNMQESVDRYEAALADLRALADEAAPLEAEYADRRWSRFFLVKNTGGHIHSSMACSTCHPTTVFGWLPALSGLSEKDAVDAHGTILCSVCFPSAPVEWTVGNTPTKTYCDGSGQYVASDDARYSKYRKCPVCGDSVTITSSLALRKHGAKTS